MAKQFTTGTLNQPDAGSLGLAMQEKIRDDVVAHAAWELVEEFTPGGGVIEWTVLRCLAASSGLPDAYYVIIGRRLSDGVCYFMMAEDYNEATNVISKFGRRGASSSTMVYDADGATVDTFTLGTVAPTTSSGQPGYFFWTPSGLSTKWWLIVDDDGFTVAMNGGVSNQFIKVGAFTPLSEIAQPFPVCLSGSSDSQGWVLRNPAVAGLTTYQGALQVEAGCNSSVSSNNPRLGFEGEYRYNDKLQDNKRPLAEMGVSVASIAGVTDYMNVTGWAMGKLKDMRYSPKSQVAGLAFGDAFVLNGTLWVPWLPTDGRIFDTGVASS